MKTYLPSICFAFVVFAGAPDAYAVTHRAHAHRVIRTSVTQVPAAARPDTLSIGVTKIAPQQDAFGPDDPVGPLFLGIF